MRRHRLTVENKQWKPRHGKAKTISFLLFIAVVVGVLVASALHAAAQDPQAAPAAHFDWRSMINMLIPALWGAMGPLAIATITGAVNKYAHAYVPRYVQVVLSSVLGATAAGLTGDVGTAVTDLTMMSSMVTGGVSQVYAATDPQRLLTSEKPPETGQEPT